MTDKPQVSEDSHDEPIRMTRPLLPDREAFADALEDVWAGEWLTNNGDQSQRLEHRLREHLGVGQLSLFNNGTIALLVGLQSLRLQGEVITTPFTFPATTHVLAWNGLTPVFCDIDPDTFTIDPAQIESRITNKTSGILGVHVFGNPCAVDAIDAIADQHGLSVIYDAAHAFGTQVFGRPIGTFGDMNMFSFHATKLFHTAEGGALVYRSPALKRRVDLLRNFGIKNEEEVILPGINGKMNEIQAVLGLLVLDMVDEERSRRRGVRERYRAGLNGLAGLRLVEPPATSTNSEQYFVIEVTESEFGSSRDRVFGRLRQAGILARKYFHPLTSDYPCYRQLPTAADHLLPVAHRAADSVLTLPFYGRLALNEVDRICSVIRSSRQ